MPLSAYGPAARAVLDRIEATQGKALEAAADAVFASLKGGGVLHVFGSGHSHAVAEEAFHRAGGLVPVNLIQEAFLTPLTAARKSGHLERVSGIAAVLLEASGVKSGEVLLVISNSGINAVPVEMALEGKARGLTVIALTSVAHARATASRQASGKRLFEVADCVLDNCGEVGDAAVAYPNLKARVAPTSLLAGVYLLNNLVCRVVERFLDAGLTPPLYMSANVPGGDEHNRALEARYRDRIPGL
ncbi:MAG: SIS domain-containing protein [candidate division NC10 bacterium]|nr:SIS domain-containing protein [candidate division NC10 bacterium]